MYKYIITWVISTVVSEPCPDANRVDEFGIENNGYTTCAVFHGKIVKESKTKNFIDRDSAFYFYNRGTKQINNNGFYGLGSSITEIKIDSIKVDK